MHCIQGSDAHRLDGDPARKKNLGVGDRVTEALLPEPSFEALKALFASHDFARTRPRRKQKEEVEYDHVRAAQEEGSNIIQDFHEQMTLRGGKLYAIIADVCAFANTNGGTLYIGVGRDAKAAPPGIANAQQAIKQLEQEISTRISPALECTVDSHMSRGKNILRILVPRGHQPPYAVDESKIYIREENETSLAVRDEIVNLVLSGQGMQQAVMPEGAAARAEQRTPAPPPPARSSGSVSPPRTGVEIVSVTERDGQEYYTVKDLRNGNQVTNVTVKSARRLWHYAITRYAEMPKDLNQAAVQWQGDLGLVRRHRMGQGERFDLVQRGANGPRYYFGVTEEGIDDAWRRLLGLDE
jgi:hypothetical protein